MSLTPRIDNLEQNHVINGNFDFWQRGTTINAPAGFFSQYLADRFRYDKGAGAAALTVSRSTDVPTVAESGFKSTYSLGHQVTTAQTVFAPGDSNEFVYPMEGYDLASIFGKKCTLSFWVKASTVGTYCVSVRASTNISSYVVEYSIDQANTWEKKSVIIDLSIASAGDFNFLNTIGLSITWPQNREGSFTSPTTGAWQAGLYNTTPNQVNNLGTIGNTFRLSQIMLNVGTAVGQFNRSAPSVTAEFQRCQRYYYRIQPGDMFGTGFFQQTNVIYVTVPFPVESRVEAPLLEPQSNSCLNYERATSSSASSNGGFAYLRNGENGAVIGFTGATAHVAGQGTVVYTSGAEYFAFNGEF